ncbi:importin-4-like [Centruroides sculpturatus]|uniref:importin-4-like n=1 Tax=Centruroides sculpturatus TaxID=218467 RepID=UPI000C6EDEDF|nr:importin-4-like [Centruroides sculpturatus]
MIEILEDILLRLLVPDNAVIQRATEELKTHFRDNSIIPSLCTILVSSTNVQVRQYSAILLRRKLSKRKQWEQLDQQLKNSLKVSLLEFVTKENEKAVINCVVQLIASIAKHELENRNWQELFQFLNRYVHGGNHAEKHLGLYVLNAVTSTSAHHLKPFFKSFLSLFGNTLIVRDDKWIPLYSIKIMTNMIAHVGTDEMNKFQTLMPLVINVIKDLSITDEDLACEAMEIFDELIESEIAILAPHVLTLNNVCISLASDKNLGDSLRVKSLAIMRWLIKMKKKVILKKKLTENILNILFVIMCEPQDLSDDEENDDCSSQLPSTFAAQVIDTMALHFPPERVVLPLLKLVEPALSSDDVFTRKAAYIAIAVMVEGCSEYIKDEYLDSFLKIVCRGIIDECILVRNSALFTFGQFAEFLQPDINKYIADLLPLLLQFLFDTCKTLQEGKVNLPNLTRSFYALETFCENLDDDLIPYLPTLMERLMEFLTSVHLASIHELVISAIGAVASAVKGAMGPYFPTVVEHLKALISGYQSGSVSSLQVQTIDTLGILIRTVEPSDIAMSHECIKLGLEMIDKIHDPDLRRSVYGLFASVSCVLKSDMAPYLPSILEHMIDSLLSTEGIVPCYTNEANGSFMLFDDLDNDNEEDIGSEDEEEDVDIAEYNIENAYLEEKEDTCSSLGEIAENVGVVFLPYFEKCFEELKKLIDHPNAEIRKSAELAVGKICLSLLAVAKESGNEEHHLIANKLSQVVVAMLITLVTEERERMVVLSALETLNDILKECGKTVLGNNCVTIFTIIKDAFKQKLPCQGDDDDGEEDDDDVAEYDNVLIELAGDLIPTMASLIPSQEFMPYLSVFLPLLFMKAKKSHLIADKSFAIGIIAETIKNLEKGSIVPFALQILPTFLESIKDKSEEVRSNAAFGIGVLAENAGESLFRQYPVILQGLSTMMSKETDARAKDNICGAIARLIMTNREGVPLKQVLPVFLQCLPLTTDFEENSTIFNCINELFVVHCEEIFQNLPQVLKIIGMVLPTPHITNETSLQLRHLVNCVQREYPNDFNSVLQNMPKECSEVLKQVILSIQ